MKQTKTADYTSTICAANRMKSGPVTRYKEPKKEAAKDCRNYLDRYLTIQESYINLVKTAV